MRPDFTLPSQNNFQFTDTLPPDYNGYVLAGGKVLTATHPIFGIIIQQEFSNTHYTIQHNFFDVLNPFKLIGRQTAARLTSFLSIRNTLDLDFKGIGNMKLKHAQFGMLHSGDIQVSANFYAAKTYECIEISWKDEWLLSVQEQFEFVKTLFVPMKRRRKGYFLPPKPRPAGVEVLRMASRILSLHYGVDISKLFYECHAHEYMLLLLIESVKKPIPLLRLTEQERDTVLILAERVKTVFNKKFVLEDLAQEAHMNPRKFDRAFREIVGAPLSRVSKTARMNEALRLLLETDLPPKQIKDMVGFRFTTSFIKNFKKFFGFHVSETRPSRKE